MTGTVLPTVIMNGHIPLEVPNGMSVEDALETYKASYPELAFADIRPAGVVDNKNVYEVYREQKVGTKG